MESTKLLVSFCNVFPRGFGLGIFDFENEAFEWVNLDKISDEIMGVTGITFHDSHYWILTQLKPGGVSSLAKLNKNFDLVQNFNLELTKDVHSLVPIDNGFLVTDTKRNRINKITLLENQLKVQEEIYWKYNDDETDTVHVNSMTKYDGKIYISIMGHKVGENWSLTEDGKIIEIPTNRIIYQNINHPHSLLTIDDELYCLESKTSNIHRFSKRRNHETILELNGYLRGISIDKNYFYIGASAFRRKSKSTGNLNAPIDLKPDDFHSWIYRVNKNDLSYEKKDMTMYAAEIYDILSIKHPYTISSDENPIVKRIWKYEDICLNIDKKIN